MSAATIVSISACSGFQPVNGRNCMISLPGPTRLTPRMAMATPMVMALVMGMTM